VLEKPLPGLSEAARKSGGIIPQRQANLFALRLRVPAGGISAAQLATVAGVASRYGRGAVHLTLRQGIEIQYVPFADIPAALAELADVGLELGACGRRVRVVTACPGAAVCPNGLGDAQALAKRLDDRYFGLSDLPHKVKIAVAGCPSACAKPQENDIGLMAVAAPVLTESEEAGCIGCGLCARKCPAQAIALVQGKPVIDRARCLHDGKCINVCPTGALRAERTGWQMYVGGKCGKEPRIGVPLVAFLSDAEAEDLVGRVIAAYRQLGKPGERLGTLVERLGLQALAREVLGTGCAASRT